MYESIEDVCIYFGQRLKHVRKLASFNLKELSERIGIPLDVLSKYEKGSLMPDSSIIIKIANELDVHPGWLLRPKPPVKLRVINYAKNITGINSKTRKDIVYNIQDWLERYIDIENIMSATIPFNWNDFRRKIEKKEDVENIAEDLRHEWGIGANPIANLTQIIEEKGIYIGITNLPEKIEVLSLLTVDNKPVIVIQNNISGYLQRFSLAKGIGYLCLDMPKYWGNKIKEIVVSRFAMALIVPQSAVLNELGGKLNHFGLDTFKVLSKKYGLNTQMWIYRAQDIGILSQEEAYRILVIMRKNQSETNHLEDTLLQEYPSRMFALVQNALNTGVITENRYYELIGQNIFAGLIDKTQFV
ncbi:MAG: XRE family transcriptional regulator [Methylacidiphilales bacterium]|nr:XRE family transcriptional regulator [Candidatus Methylacidiphilales bacterium]